MALRFAIEGLGRIGRALLRVAAGRPELELVAELRRGLANVVHSYTENQRLLDLAHPDPRRARAAALNLIPTSTTGEWGYASRLADLLRWLAAREEGAPR